MKDDMQFKYEAGFNGKPDIMRTRAQNIMNAEMKKADVTKLSPHSFSSGEKTKMRNYKKGGPVKKADGGSMPTKSPFEQTMKPQMKMGGKTKMALGGMVRKEIPKIGGRLGTAIRADVREGVREVMPRASKLAAAARGMAPRGMGHRIHKEMTESGRMEKPAALFEKKEASVSPMKKGGKVTRAKMHQKQEHELSEVKSMIKKEGKMKECHGGGKLKLAIGGAGKIRHKEMTEGGKQLNAKGKPTSKRCHGGY